MNKLEFANSLYNQYLKEWDKTVQQVLSQKYAIEKDRVIKTKQRVKKLFQRPKTLYKKVFDWDIEDEIWQERYKRERELSNF